MRIIKMWVAVHPTQADNYEVQFYKPAESGIYLDTQLIDEGDAWVDWVEYACVPLEEGLLDNG